MILQVTWRLLFCVARRASSVGEWKRCYHKSNVRIVNAGQFALPCVVLWGRFFISPADSKVVLERVR